MLDTSVAGFLHEPHDRATFDDSDEERQAFLDADKAVKTYASAFSALEADYTRQNELQANTLDVVGPLARTAASDSPFTRL